jgi:adenine nucleotide transporter 17
MSWAALRSRVAVEGVSWMYNGFFTSCISTGASDFVYFYTYHYFKSPHPITNLCVRCLAGIANTLLTTPLWVVVHRIRSAQQSDARGQMLGLVGVLRSIVKNEGLLALWQGTAASLLLVANPVIHHFTNDALKKWWCQRWQQQQKGGRQNKRKEQQQQWWWWRQQQHEHEHEEEHEEKREEEQERGQQQQEEKQQYQRHQQIRLNSTHYFVFGALAKCIATLCTFPLQVAQARSRERSLRLAVAGTDGVDDGNGGTGTMHELLGILKAEGVQGWFKGLQTTVLNTVLNAAIAQTQYEAILRQLQAGT